jgi:hypothetical protein
LTLELNELNDDIMAEEWGD